MRSKLIALALGLAACSSAAPPQPEVHTTSAAAAPAAPSRNTTEDLYAGRSRDWWKQHLEKLQAAAAAAQGADKDRLAQLLADAEHKAKLLNVPR